MWDGMAEFYPWRAVRRRSLRHGWLPLWNPHQFCGTPFVANSQSAVFYPLNLCCSTALPTPTAFGVSVLLHLILTGLFFYGFLRSPALGLGRPAALLGAVVWQMSAWQVAWLALPTFLCVSAWLPLALWLTDRWAARPAALARNGARRLPGRDAAGGTFADRALLLPAGRRPTPCFASCRACATDRALRTAVPRHRRFALALMVGLAAPQLLPAMELARMSHRAGGPVTWAGYQGYVRLALPPVNLVTLFLPGFFGNPTQGTYWGVGTNGGPGAYMENACYVGVLALLLAFVGVGLTWRPIRRTRFFAVARPGRPAAGAGDAAGCAAVLRHPRLRAVRVAGPHPGACGHSAPPSWPPSARTRLSLRMSGNASLDSARRLLACSLS